jgi:hypothetical protein
MYAVPSRKKVAFGEFWMKASVNLSIYDFLIIKTTFLQSKKQAKIPAFDRIFYPSQLFHG